jgi:hypothetical protein
MPPGKKGSEVGFKAAPRAAILGELDEDTVHTNRGGRHGQLEWELVSGANNHHHRGQSTAQQRVRLTYRKVIWNDLRAEEGLSAACDLGSSERNNYL